MLGLLLVRVPYFDPHSDYTILIAASASFVRYESPLPLARSAAKWRMEGGWGMEVSGDGLTVGPLVASQV